MNNRIQVFKKDDTFVQELTLAAGKVLSRFGRSGRDAGQLHRGLFPITD